MRVKTLTSALLLQPVVDDRNLCADLGGLQQLRQRHLGLPDKVVLSAVVVVEHLRKGGSEGGARDGLETNMEGKCGGQQGLTLSGAQLGSKRQPCACPCRLRAASSPA